MIVRCTAKLLRLLGHSPRFLPDVAPSGEDWYANLIYIERRKCLLLVHADTLFSVFHPDLRKVDLVPVGPLLRAIIERELHSEGLPLDTFGQHDYEAVQLAKTASRSILGCMNEIAHEAEMGVLTEGGLSACDFVELNRSLRRSIHVTTGYVPPIDLAKRCAGSPPVYVRAPGIEP